MGMEAVVATYERHASIAPIALHGFRRTIGLTVLLMLCMFPCRKAPVRSFAPSGDEFFTKVDYFRSLLLD
jgi:hypothetical protein